MRQLAGFLLCTSVVLVRSVWQKPAFCGEHECPEFKVVEKGSGYEKRNYASATWVTTSSAGEYKDASAETYFKLRNFLNTSNELNKAMPMAIPSVTMMFPTTGLEVMKNFTRFFFIPAHLGPAPKPNDTSISVKEVPPKDMYIRQIEGRVSTVAEWVQHANDLASAINDTSKYYPSFFFTAVYNTPFDTGKIHNEVWFYAL